MSTATATIEEIAAQMEQDAARLSAAATVLREVPGMQPPGAAGTPSQPCQNICTAQAMQAAVIAAEESVAENIEGLVQQYNCTC